MLLQQIGSSVGASSVSKVSIPRAVGVVATYYKRRYLEKRKWVSIPRAVGVVATNLILGLVIIIVAAFQYRER